MNTLNAPNRLVVVGASAGGPQVLQTLVAHLKPDIAAAILIVQHLSPYSPNLLPSILESAGVLPVMLAQDGAPITAGQIYLAPPDHHLLVEVNGGSAGCLRLSRSARQNRVRPAIDLLFRSAAAAYDAQTIGVLLTGLLDDGVNGLRAIHVCGGVTIIQEPSEAPYPDMVNHALAAVPVDYQLPVQAIADLLNRLVAEPITRSGSVPEELRLETAIILAAESKDQTALEPIGQPTIFSCPACGGHLWQISNPDSENYLCEVGHGYSRQSLRSVIKGPATTRLSR